MAAPRRPRRPPAPPSPRALRVPRPLRLSPIRSRESVALDQHRTPKSGLELPPFIRFDKFMADVFEWKVGQHITIIGPTGQGKTRLARELLPRRDWVVVLGVKNRDKELYGPFERDGYELTGKFDAEPGPGGDQRVLFVPRTELHGQAARNKKAEAFREVLNDVVDTGAWCVYADDIQYMAQKLRLAPEFEELWLIGRSEGVSLVVSSTEPVDIPVMSYGFATHLILFRNPDLYRARRMAELTGINREVTQETLLKLPDHEFLYINKDSQFMCRSMVIV